MIKILEGPEPAVCSNCGCKFTYEASDVKSDMYLDRYAFLGILPLNKHCRAVRCPICNEPYVIQSY